MSPIAASRPLIMRYGTLYRQIALWFKDTTLQITFATLTTLMGTYTTQHTGRSHWSRAGVIRRLWGMFGLFRIRRIQSVSEVCEPDIDRSRSGPYSHSIVF
jgi:hypothetical protein